MKQLKSTYQKVIRTAQYFSEVDRTKFVRMDGNESIDGLPQEFISEVLGEIDSNYLATYPNPKKCTESIAEYVNLPRENILVTNGSDSAIKMIFEVYAEQNDRIIMTNPTFEMYGVYATMYGANAIRVDYQMDLQFPYEQYFEEMKKGAKLAVIVNPDNPTGSVLEQSKLLEIIDYAENEGIIIIIDEAYFGFYSKTVIDKILEYNNLIVLRTFSKLMGLAGLRLGFMAANEDIVGDVKKIALTAAVNTVALKFGEKLLQKKDIIDTLLANYEREKMYLEQQLQENDISFIHSESNFVLIPWEGNLKIAYENFKLNGILVACRFNKYIRINVGNEEATDKFIEVCKKLK